MKVSGQVSKGKVATLPNVSQSKAFDSNEKESPAQLHASTAPEDTRLPGESGFNRIVKIDCNMVDDSPYQNPFRDYEAESLDLLGGAMEEAGQGEPIQVRRKGERYELIAGHRRIRAARIKGWTQIDAIVLVLDDHQALQKVITHNEGRKTDPDFALASMYRFALDSNLGNQKKIAKLFATTETHVSRCLSMLQLPAPIVAMLKKNPNLFAVKTTEIINQLRADHPTEEPLIVQAVERLQDGAPASSIKSWFEQMLKQKARKGTAGDHRPKVIADAKGRQLFSAKRTGRVITVRISASDVDPDETMQKVMDSLKKYSTEASNKDQ